MSPFDSLIFKRIHNYSKSHLESSGKLPRLWEENDDSGKKFKRTEGLTSSTEYHHQVEQEPPKNFHNLDALFLDTAPAFQSYEHRMQELANIESQYSELIKPHTQTQTQTHTPNHDAVPYVTSGQKLSTDAIIRLGGERFIQSFSSSMKDISMPSHPYGTSFSGLSDQQVNDIQLIENLLLSAEKVNQQQFERASKLLDWCDMLSSSSGNPIQRLVHYFSKALKHKISGEIGRIPFIGSGKKHVQDMLGKMMIPNPTALSVYQKLPFFQAGQFSGVQALVDGVAGSKKVHIIDLAIRQGLQCTILMQALVSQANCPIEHLKITAVGVNFKQETEQTGDRLKSFAESMNLSFTFNAVIVEDMLEFKEELLELDLDEVLAVYSSHGLWTMLAQQDRLESLMKVIKSTNPRVMVVCETAVNLNSPNFVNRFIEALFYYGAFFDALEDCMGCEDENRVCVESMYLANGIWSLVAAEGAERAIRHVNIDVWRKFFARFGMQELELSMSSIYQANLMVEKVSCGNFCTLDMDGNCLVIGWKGTPIQSLSAWKFS